MKSLPKDEFVLLQEIKQDRIEVEFAKVKFKYQLLSPLGMISAFTFGLLLPQLISKAQTKKLMAELIAGLSAVALAKLT